MAPRASPGRCRISATPENSVTDTFIVDPSTLHRVPAAAHRDSLVHLNQTLSVASAEVPIHIGGIECDKEGNCRKNSPHAASTPGLKREANRRGAPRPMRGQPHRTHTCMQKQLAWFNMGLSEPRADKRFVARS